MNELEGAYPVRLPVWWARRGAAGPHPELEGITGRFIVIRHPKRFRKFEGLLARLLRAPKELRRPLDDLNSLLWELCDGTRSFEEICNLMDSTFHERISPVVDRTTAALTRLNQLSLIGLSKNPYDGEWERGPGHDPSGDLPPPDERLELDWD
jgi:hypothetical protein